MKIFDEKARLFGKINIIDASIIFLTLVLIVVYAALVRRTIDMKDAFKRHTAIIKMDIKGCPRGIYKLVKEGDVIELTTSYSKGPFRQAYRIYDVSKPKPRGVSYLRRLALASGYRRALRY